MVLSFDAVVLHSCPFLLCGRISQPVYQLISVAIVGDPSYFSTIKILFNSVWLSLKVNLAVHLSNSVIVVLSLGKHLVLEETIFPLCREYVGKFHVLVVNVVNWLACFCTGQRVVSFVIKLNICFI